MTRGILTNIPTGRLNSETPRIEEQKPKSTGVTRLFKKWRPQAPKGVIIKTLTAVVYMDYESIQEFFSQYGKTLRELDFFTVLLDKFQSDGLRVIDFIAYGNLEPGSSFTKLQTYLWSLGLQTRHSFKNARNSRCEGLTVDTLRFLYRNPGMDLYIFITSDLDIITLLKAIRYEEKLTYFLTTRNDFNQNLTKYAGAHEFLEDIFHLPQK